MSDKVNARVESAMEVKAYLQNLKYALVNGAQINFQDKRLVDDNRDERYTNQYTVNKRIRRRFHGHKDSKNRKAVMHMLYGES